MARVLISYFSDYGETMYDALSDVLLHHGNDVFRLNTNNKALFKFNKWGGEITAKSEAFLKNIEAFKAEVVFNFNHSLPGDIYEYLPSTSKICVIDADNPETFWNSLYLKKNVNNYYFLGLQSYSKTMYEKFLDMKLKEGINYLYFPPATVVKKQDITQNKNISFIGSNFYPFYLPSQDEFYGKEGLYLFHKIKEDYYYRPRRDEVKSNKEFKILQSLVGLVGGYYVGQDRLKFLEVITDLGLTLYGVRGWGKIASYDFSIAECFDSTPQTTLLENQWVYNTSKVSINISHPQAKSSFSWRVMDIMASNACLLTEDKPDWRELFERYLSDEVKNSIIYKDRFDMREKAILLLNNNELRKKCVQELNFAIEQNGRWEHRFKSLEDFLSIKILNNDHIASYTFISKDVGQSYSGTNEALYSLFIHHVAKGGRSIKRRFVIMGCSFLLFLSVLPIFDKVLKKKKIVGFLNKKLDR